MDVVILLHMTFGRLLPLLSLFVVVVAVGDVCMVFFFWFSRILSLSHSLSNRFTYLTNSTSRYQLLDFIIRLVLLFESTTLSLRLVFIFSMASRAFHMNVQPSIFYPRFSSSIAVALSSFPWEIIKKILSIHF